MGTTFLCMMGYMRTQQEDRDAEKILRTLTEAAERTCGATEVRYLIKRVWAKD